MTVGMEMGVLIPCISVDSLLVRHTSFCMLACYFGGVGAPYTIMLREECCCVFKHGGTQLI